jgi:hypothetical protein
VKRSGPKNGLLFLWILSRSAFQSQYEDSVLPAARQYLLPRKCFANLVLDSEADLSTVEQNLYDAIVEKHAPAGGR